jgi:hypothetical protein
VCATHAKIRSSRKNQLHKLSTALVEEYGVIEGLDGVTDASERMGLYDTELEHLPIHRNDRMDLLVRHPSISEVMPAGDERHASVHAGVWCSPGIAIQWYRTRTGI